MTYTKMELDGFLVPITVYFKGDRENIGKAEINAHLETILKELRRPNIIHP